MTTLREIELAVSSLSEEDLSAFRRWFIEFDAGAWDRQIEKDMAAGRLDVVAEDALQDLHEGRRAEL